MKKNLYIIAGCNGAGKTTASFAILPAILDCKEFVNADEIARGLSPFQPGAVAIGAGRIMLHRIDELLALENNFAFETTLASKSYIRKVLLAQKRNFNVTLLFFWLESVELAIERVRTRVAEGGHHVATEDIERRYRNGIKNLFKVYLNVVDEVLIFDNSRTTPQLIAEKNRDSELVVWDETKFHHLKNNYNETL